jgi:alpha-1,3-rhamnosyl/mannosyltransferase
MRIAIDARKLGRSGIGIYIKNLVTALARIDHTNEYILILNPCSETGLLPDLPANFRRTVISANLFSLMENVQLPFLFWKESVEVFHSTHFFLPVIKTVKSVVTIHDLIPIIFASEYSFAKRKYLSFMISRAITGADMLLADSRHTRDDILRYYSNIPHGKVTVVHIAQDEKPRSTDNETILQRHRLSVGQYILYVGSDKYNKNLQGMIEAYEALEDKTDIPLVMVGNIDARMYGRPNVRILGMVEDAELDCIYRNALVFAAPSFYEGFGLPVLEAMSRGVPVITSRKSSTAEVAGGAAVLVDPYNREELTSAFMEVLGSQGLRSLLAHKGIARAAEFSWVRTAKQTLDSYERAYGGT